MAFVEDFRSHLTRRKSLVMAAGTLALVGLSGRAKAAANVIDVTAPPYNASPNLADNTPNFQSALNALLSLGGGVLLVPPGSYALQGQLNYNSTNASLTISGYGSALSVLVVKHTGIGLNVSYSYVGDNQSLVVKDIGFAPAPGSGLAGTAIAFAMPNVQSAWQACRIENVDFGVQYPNYTAFSQALSLTNVWRSIVTNCVAHGNSATGNTFLALNGTCIDTRVLSCNIDSYTTGVSVGAYSEGLHIVDTVFIGGTALTTGTMDYGNGNINLLGLYISGCELNCTNVVLSLYQVSSAWISDNDLYGPRVSGGSVACAMIGSARLKVSKCLFGGFLNPVSPSNQIGIQTSNSSKTITEAITVDDCSFENTLTAISLGIGTTNFTSLGIRMLAGGNGMLVNTPIVYGSFLQQPLVDNSGNTTNMVDWLATTNATSKTTSTRTIYSR